MSDTLGTRIAAALLTVAQAYAAGDQVPPCAVLWTDPDQLWEPIIPELRRIMPALYQLGAYASAEHTGPAFWLRCIEARLVAGAPAAGTLPVFYLPGISRDQLRSAENCPPALAALVELQYRGAMWMHVNGRDWTPYAFLISKHGGLELDVAKNQETLDAISRALPELLKKPLTQLHGRRLDAEFFNGLVAPDTIGLMLRWLANPNPQNQPPHQAEWIAFCQQCRLELSFDPAKDGQLQAAKLLAARGSAWNQVWQRFADAPANYSGIVDLLRRAAPVPVNMFESTEVWPTANEAAEARLKQELEELKPLAQHEVIRRVTELEAQHAIRRGHPWQKLGLSPMATALEPLAQLAGLCEAAAGGPTPESFAHSYAAAGWRVDAAALATMAACGSPEQHTAVLAIVRAVYLPWLESTARHLQQLLQTTSLPVAKRVPPIQPASGRIIVFADGLRMDVAQKLKNKLDEIGAQSTQDWEWSTVPSVTATAKYAASPIAAFCSGGDAGDEFSTRLSSTSQLLTKDRFSAALKELGWQVLGPDQTGDPTGSAWTECGSLDKRGHSEGWKLAHSIDNEIRDLTSRIEALLQAGWSEVRVITDHGWLLVPHGLPKIELKSFLTEARWGRCAALKTNSNASTLVFQWHWNPDVNIASPPGAGCFIAGMEYSHGGISLQEMVTPVLSVTAQHSRNNSPALLAEKWSHAQCRISVAGDCAGFRVDVRTSQSDPATSLLSDRQARELTPAGTVTVFLENDSDTGITANIVLLNASGQVIAALTTITGE